jgi:hypothetical protein
MDIVPIKKEPFSDISQKSGSVYLCRPSAGPRWQGQGTIS